MLGLAVTVVVVANGWLKMSVSGGLHVDDGDG